MDEEMFRIIITGELVSGCVEEETVKKLAVLLRQPVDTIAAQFGLRPITFRAVFSSNDAERLCRQLREIGVMTRLVPLREAAGKTLESGAAEDRAAGIRHMHKRSLRRFGGMGVLIAFGLAVAYTAMDYLSMEKPWQSAEPVADSKPVTTAAVKKRKVLVYANDSMPEAVVATPEGRQTFLNMNVLSAGIELAAMAPASGVSPGMNQEVLAEALAIPQSALRDAWGETFWVSIGDKGVVIASVGPDGELDTADDMVMYRKTELKPLP